ncbi:hypothetical protein ACFELO_09310 [Oceanicaulis sp. LC35]|uniref:hypothetical protein n=1 Tax=Oceanicaulis sp. LC35 TaxID=3349635 RepID=UPI003F863048
MIRNLCVAAIRLLALYLGAITLPNLLFSLMRLLSGSDPFSNTAYEIQNFLGLGITIVLAIALWVFSGFLTKVIAPEAKNPTESDIKAQDFVLIGLCLIGANTLINSLPDAIIYTTEVIRSRAAEGAAANSNMQLQVQVRSGLASLLLEAIISSVFGAGLLFFGFRLRPFLRKFQTLRTAGHDKPEPISASKTSERS